MALSKKQKIWLIVLCAFTLALTVFFGVLLSNVIGVSAAVKKSDNAEQVHISYEYKSYADKKDGKDTKYESSPLVMYYAKNGEGYDLVCGDFSVFDNVAYSASTGLYLGSGSKAEIRSEDSAREYAAYFKDFSKHFDENAAIKTARFDLSAVASALKKYKTLFSFKSTENGTTEYKLYYGKSFYKYLLRKDYEHINSPFSYPVIVKVEKGKLVEVSLKVELTYKATIWPSSTYTARKIFDYKIRYDYEKTLSPTQAQENYPYGFYQTIEPEKPIELVDSYYDPVKKYHNGKYYRVGAYDPETERRTLTAYDLKTGEATDKVLLPVGGYNFHDGDLFIADGYLYLSVGDLRQILRYDLTEKTTAVYTFDGDMQVRAIVGDRILAWETSEGYYIGNDLASLQRAETYDEYGYNGVYYENGQAYVYKEIGDQKYVTQITPDGEAGERLDVSGYDEWYFNSDGIVAVKREEVNLQWRVTECTQYGWDFSLIKTYEPLSYVGLFLEETDEFIFYEGYGAYQGVAFAYEKESGLYYAYAGMDVYGYATKYDGVFYSNKDGAVYQSDGYKIVDNFN